MKRLAFVVCLFFGSATTLLAQDVCTATTDLQRLFVTLIDVADSPISPAQLRNLEGINDRYTAFEVHWTFRQSEVSDQLSIITNAHAVARSAIAGFANNNATSPLLAGQNAINVLTLGGAVLGRLDCPPPIGLPSANGEQTRLPRNDAAPASGKSILGQIDFFKLFASLATVAALGGWFYGAFVLHNRNSALRKRYSCDLPVTFSLPALGGAVITARADDISRAGIRIGSCQGAIPGKHTTVTININGTTTKTLHVKWANSHYFGGQFAKAFTRSELRSMIRKKTRTSTRRRGAKRSVPPSRA